jgi:hypothetical protein
MLSPLAAPPTDVILSAVQLTPEETENFGNVARELMRAGAVRPSAAIGDADFRGLHSPRGGSMHGLECSLSYIRSNEPMTRDQATCFFEGVDAARQVVDGATAVPMRSLATNGYATSMRTAPHPSREAPLANPHPWPSVVNNEPDLLGPPTCRGQSFAEAGPSSAPTPSNRRNQTVNQTTLTPIRGSRASVRVLALGVLTAAASLVALRERWMTPPMTVATVAYALIVAGFALRRSHRSAHAALMSAGMIIDLALVLTLQGQRDAIGTALAFTLTPLQQAHVAVSTVATVLYIPLAILGAQLYFGRPGPDERTHWHRRLGIAAFLFRTLGFVLMFSMLGRS